MFLSALKRPLLFLLTVWLLAILLPKEAHTSFTRRKLVLATTTISAPIYDGIGNIVGLVDEMTHARVATYENSTTQENLTDSINKTTLAESITGNASQPWNISYNFPGTAGWTKTITHATDGSLTASTVYDALGREQQETIPDPNGTGSTETTTYGYANGLLSSATDPVGTTTYSYQPDGSLGEISRGGRYVNITRSTSSSSEIEWNCTDATGETLWQQYYYPGTESSTYLPYGQSGQGVTTTPQISGGVLTLNGSGSSWTSTLNWQEGSSLQYVYQGPGLSFGRNESEDPFGELATDAIEPGDSSGNAVTTSYSPLGLPSGVSGLVNASYSDSFDATAGLTQTLTQNSHTGAETVAPAGDWTGFTGYGQPDQSWSAPGFGSTVSRTLTTGAGAAPFKWSLQGTLLQRQYPDGTSESFQYDGNGALSNWTTPRSSFNFAPNEYGEPTQIGSMGTLGYDLAGRVNSISDAAGACSLSYTNGELATLSYSSGALAGDSVGRTYNSAGQLTSVALPGSVTISYTYSSGELTGVTTAGGATGTWSSFDVVNGRAQGFTIGPLSVTGSFDGLGRVTYWGSTADGVTSAYSGRSYDADGHCTGVTAPEGAWTYGYSSYGYLQSASGPQTISYSFDQAERQSGATDYRPTARVNSGNLNVVGSVAAGASVTINGTAVSVSGSGEFDQGYTPTPNSWQTYVVIGALPGAGMSGSAAIEEEVRHAFVPPDSESLGYDADGDRDSSTRWTQNWNSLDQLTSVVDARPFSPATAQEIDYVYDVEGRCVEATYKTGGNVTKTTTTLWDGWRPVMRVTSLPGGTVTDKQYYTWGPDVSGDIDGAAGIGGLIEILDESGTSTATRSLPIYDGIGNVTGYVDGTTGARVATYEYGPFGELLTAYGPRANLCPFLFQTKMYEPETGYYYFGKRWLDPKTGWLSRDPIRENGGINLYAYCGDDPVGNFDPIGETNFDQDHPVAWWWLRFISGAGRSGKSLLGLFEVPSDTDEYADNVQAVANGVTMGIPQMAAASDDPQQSGEVVKEYGRMFTTPEGLGSLSFGLTLGFAGPKVLNFVDPTVTPAPSGLDMIDYAKQRVQATNQQYGGIPAFAKAGDIIPRGFVSAEEFANFGSTLKAGLSDAGFADTQAIFQGSSVTGASFDTGESFDVGRVSDYDIALTGKSIFQQAQSLGIALRSAGTRTGPLNAIDLQRLGLSDLAARVGKQAGRPVNFMIYQSPEAALLRGPGIIVP